MRRSLSLAVLLLVAAPVAACAPALAPIDAEATLPAPAPTPIERAERAWARIRGVAVIAAAALPEPYASAVRRYVNRGDRALDAARAAANIASQLLELRKLDAAAKALAPRVGRVSAD